MNILTVGWSFSPFISFNPGVSVSLFISQSWAFCLSICLSILASLSPHLSLNLGVSVSPFIFSTLRSQNNE